MVRTTRTLPMVPTGGKGKDLMDLLCKELGIPPGVRWFEVRFALSEAVRVTLEYTPRADAEDETKTGSSDAS